MKKLTAILLTMVLAVTIILQPSAKQTEAATVYITVDAFIKSLATSLKLPVNESLNNPYIEAAKASGILKDGDFKKYTGYLTRTDAAVLLNRADEYLNGDTVDADLVSIVLKKRISDITKISARKREAVAKIVAKGIIKGYGNGYYIQNREFRGSSKVTKDTAKDLISLVLNSSKRAKISPDGMLIRTTNLPKNASKYDYILVCYPNSFYERQFEFMLISDWKTDTDDWAYPVDMKNETFKNWYTSWPLKTEMDKHLYEWSAMAEKYLNYVFNVDYRTVDDEWINELGNLHAKSNINKADSIRKFYIGKMKANKVIVESSVIAVEPSTFYDDGDYCMRAYVRYRITAQNINVDQSELIYTQYPQLHNLKSGEWRTGIFDVRFGTNNGSSGDGADFAIDSLTYFVDAINVPAK